MLYTLDIFEKVISSYVLCSLITKRKGFPSHSHLQLPSMVFELDGDPLLRKPDVQIPPVRTSPLIRELQTNIRTGLSNFQGQGVLKVCLGMKDRSLFCQIEQQLSYIKHGLALSRNSVIQSRRRRASGVCSNEAKPASAVGSGIRFPRRVSMRALM